MLKTEDKKSGTNRGTSEHVARELYLDNDCLHKVALGYLLMVPSMEGVKSYFCGEKLPEHNNRP